MSGDLINGLFEFVGALFILLNVRAMVRDKVVMGVSTLPTIFFSSWGIWNLYYYPSLDQWYSFAGGVAIVLANCLWLGLTFYYLRRQRASLSPP